MELTVKLISFLEAQTGTSAKGEWTKQDVIFETIESYPKKICIGFWKESAQLIKAVSIGSELKVSINVESREYNGKYYTEVKAWKYEIMKGVTMDTIKAEMKQPLPQVPDNDSTGKLPF